MKLEQINNMNMTDLFEQLRSVRILYSQLQEEHEELQHECDKLREENAQLLSEIEWQKQCERALEDGQAAFGDFYDQRKPFPASQEITGFENEDDRTLKLLFREGWDIQAAKVLAIDRAANFIASRRLRETIEKAYDVSSSTSCGNHEREWYDIREALGKALIDLQIPEALEAKVADQKNADNPL